MRSGQCSSVYGALSLGIVCQQDNGHSGPHTNDHRSWEAVVEQATELEYLKWFFRNADFGPADGDVHFNMNERFVKETGKELPEGYETE